MIKRCTCTNAYQDAKYGHGMRVHNPYNKNGGGWRCTVCKSEKQAAK